MDRQLVQRRIKVVIANILVLFISRTINLKLKGLCFLHCVQLRQCLRREEIENMIRMRMVDILKEKNKGKIAV